MNNEIKGDNVYGSFLRYQFEEGRELADSSDLLELDVLNPGSVPRAFIATYRCKGLVKQTNGEIIEASDFRVGIYFPDDYLRRINPSEVITWLWPMNIYHPNINSPFICLGHMYPGMGLTDILRLAADIITYRNVTMVESDALNTEACMWARKNKHRFPFDDRPLKRNSLNLQVNPVMEKDNDSSM